MTRMVMRGVILVGVAFAWGHAIYTYSRLTTAEGRVVDIVTFQTPDSQSNNSGGYAVFAFQLPDGRTVQARSATGGPGGPGLGEVTTIHYRSEDADRFASTYDKDRDLEEDWPEVYGSLLELLLIPAAVTLFGGLLWLFTLKRRKRDQVQSGESDD